MRRRTSVRAADRAPIGTAAAPSVSGPAPAFRATFPERRALHSRHCRLAPAIVILLLLHLSAFDALAQTQAASPAASETLSTEERAALERVALASARADLAQAVADLPLGPGQTLGMWAARDVARARTLRMWLRSLPRSGAARFYSDGTCEVEVRLAADELCKQIAELQARPASGEEPLADSTLRAAAGQWNLIWGYGLASAADRVRGSKPLGWEDVAPEGIELARQAALADAIEALLEQAGACRVTNARRASEFLSSGEGLREAVRGELAKVTQVRVELAPDQVALAEARVPMKELIRVLAEVHRTRYQGDLFHAADFREMALLNDAPELRANGLATPPARYLLRGGYRLLELDAPAWATQTLRAVGRFRPEPDATPDDARKLEMARLDGMNALRLQVEALVIQGETTVDQLLGYRRELKDDVATVLSGARAAGAARRLAGGVLELDVELPLSRLWRVLRRGIPATEVDPPATQPLAPARDDTRG